MHCLNYYGELGILIIYLKIASWSKFKVNLLINNRSLGQNGIDVGFQKCEIHVNESKECLSILVVFMYH